MTNFVDTRGRSPYIQHDTTRAWIESIGRQRGLIKPSVLLRVATDSNHIRNAIRTLYNPNPRNGVYTQAIMNNALPGQRIPHVLNWSVNEALDQVTQTASLECLNCLQVSRVTTTITNVNPRNVLPNDGIGTNAIHADTIYASWAQDSLFAVEQVTGPGGRNGNGNLNIEYVEDTFGYGFREANVKYRMFVDQTFQIKDSSQLPDPGIPDDDDNDVALDLNWSRSKTADGAYFILVGNEVMRVSQLDKSTNTFHVPAGGRGVNGIIESHSNGQTVTLLGYGRSTGEYAGMGYLTVDDFHPQTAVLRPGTCIVSYEGYGDITGPLTHDFDPSKNYQFTGYWFVNSVEPSLGEDGVPRALIDLRSVGAMYEDQKINIDTVQRMKNQFGQWEVKGKTLFQAAGATRNVPGDWVDFAAWDPTDQYSYPLKISIEYAQHHDFFQHMQDTQNGLTCIICHQELSDYLKTHARETARDRPVGRHIYKESIRVLREPGGPVKTYIRLMATMAAAAWDHPAYGTELSQKFTKIPNQLFDNIRNIFTGLCYNGQLDFQLATTDKTFDFATPGYDDKIIISRRKDLTCPFQSTYDNAPFSQPMLDLAAINGNQFWVTREGYPVFKPVGWNMRPEGTGYPGFKELGSDGNINKLGRRFPRADRPGYNGEWMMSYGASVATYSSQVAKEQIVTQVWVTASTAFDLDNSGNGFTLATAGSGYNEQGELVFYAPLGGHKQGLALTGGVQQVDTMTLDNQYLGLDWNTNPAGWGLVENEQGKDIVMDPKPALFDGSPAVHSGQGGTSEAVRRIQQTINFFLVRGYMDPIIVGNKTYFTLDVDGKMDDATSAGLLQLHQVLAGSQGVGGATFSANVFEYNNRSDTGREYGRATYEALKDYLDSHKYFIQTDIWWYVRNGKTWDEYVAAITGLPIPFTQGNAPKPRQTSTAYDAPLYVIDDKGLQLEIAKWYRTFAQSVANVGNRTVNESINKATTRSLASNLADPRVQPGDTIFCNIPGVVGMENQLGKVQPPFNNGIYVTNVQRQFDAEQGSYTATYTGTRQQGLFGKGVTEVINPKYDFITE